MLNFAGKRVWVTGHTGMLGRAVVRRLQEVQGCTVIWKDRIYLDLRDYTAVLEFAAKARPDIVIHCAATVDGVGVNIEKPDIFIRDNLLIDTAVLNAAARAHANIVYIGSACAYPEAAPQPFKEDSFFTGKPERTNHAYAVAKLAGMAMAEALHQAGKAKAMAIVPCNLYGPGDRSSHAIPALIRKMHAAKVAGEPSVEIWGSGRQVREFMHSHDMAECIYFIVRRGFGKNFQVTNAGSGQRIKVCDLAQLVRHAVGYQGELLYNRRQPAGMKSKVVDITRLRGMGWPGVMRDLAVTLPELYAEMYPCA